MRKHKKSHGQAPRAPRPAPRAWAVFKTRWGWMGLAAVERGSRIGICRLILPRSSRRSVELALMGAQARRGRAEVRVRGGGHQAGPSRNLARLVNEGRAQLADFLSGRRRDLDVPLVFDQGTPFQRQVWRSIARIPYGRARSYKWVAARVGGAHHARAVGMALGANPVPLLVPCHRIVAHDASLGGFTGGLRLKRRLLELEGTLPLLRSAQRRNSS